MIAILLNIDAMESMIKLLKGSEACGVHKMDRRRLAICPHCRHAACGICHKECPDCREPSTAEDSILRELD